MAAVHPLDRGGREIVRDHDVPGLEGRHEDLFDVGEETGPVHRAIQDPGRGESRHPQRGDEGAALPSTVGGVVGDPLAAKSAPIPSEEIGGDPALIQKDEVGRVEGRGGRVRTRVSFFVRVKPSWFTARQMVVRLADVARAPCSSARVRFGCSRISAARVCSGGARTGRRPYRCWREATSPVARRRCVSRRTQAALTWYVTATADAFMPASLSRRRRSRRSIE